MKVAIFRQKIQWGFQMLNWLTQNAAAIVTIVAVLFALFKYMDQQQRELRERRFEQYWKLIDTCQDSPNLAKQQLALLLLKRYPEFKDETAAFLNKLKLMNVPWAQQNVQTIDDVLNHFAQFGYGMFST
jgi:hypothetical protein